MSDGSWKEHNDRENNKWQTISAHNAWRLRARAVSTNIGEPVFSTGGFDEVSESFSITATIPLPTVVSRGADEDFDGRPRGTWARRFCCNLWQNEWLERDIRA